MSRSHEEECLIESEGSVSLACLQRISARPETKKSNRPLLSEAGGLLFRVILLCEAQNDTGSNAPEVLMVTPVTQPWRPLAMRGSIGEKRQNQGDKGQGRAGGPN